MREDTETQERFGALVRARRKKLSLTQEALGLKVGLDRTYISSLERGHRNVSLAKVVRLAHGLDTTASDLLDGL